jgi:hypothetical protein
MTGDEFADEVADERAFLLRSLQDLEREHAAGDLSDEDHAVLRDTYTARAAAVLRSSDGASDARTDAAPGRRASSRRGRRQASAAPASGRARTGRRRRVLIAAAACAVVGVTVALVVTHLSNRLPGQALTGSVAETPSQQMAQTLARAQTAEDKGDAAGAVRLYQSVLSQDPTQEQALSELGWLEYEAGVRAKSATVVSRGQNQEQMAAEIDPTAPAPHLYLGSMLLAEGRAAAAVAEYRLFLADHPRRSEVVLAVPFITKAFTEAHDPPPQLPLGAAGTAPSG